jgi:hypothetical protein
MPDPEVVQPQQATVPREGEYGYAEMQADMAGWYPALQTHALRLIDEHDSPDPTAGIEVSKLPAENEVNVTEMPGHSSEVIKYAFKGAQRTLYKMGADPKFHAMCLDEKVDPYDDMEKPKYWKVIKDYSHEVAAKIRQEDDEVGELEAATLELLGATTFYMFKQIQMDRDQFDNRQERQQAREIMSDFNGRIRSFALEYPATRTSDMWNAMLNTVNPALEDKSLRQAASQQLRWTIGGAQTESIFGQVLKHTDHRVVSATRHQDLEGVDFIVDPDTDRPLYVDVKSSQRQVHKATGSDRSFGIKHDGTVLISADAIVNKYEKHNSFFLPEEVAQAKALVLTQILEQARVKMQAS